MHSPEQKRKVSEDMRLAEKTNYQDVMGGSCRPWRETVAALGNPDGSDHLNPPNGKWGV